MNTIKSIDITKLFGSKHIQWHLQKTNVLVGKNGMGKSTILQLIVNAISQEIVYNKVSGLFSETRITIDDDNEFIVRHSVKNIAELKEIVNKIIKNGNENQEFINKINSSLILDEKYELMELYRSDDNNKKLHYEFISTVNLNANSLQNISMGDGRTTNILDWEIQNELNRLLRIRDEKINQVFISSLNVMFGESNKIVYFDDDFELKFKFNNQILDFSQLSSGERQVIYILLKVAIATKNNALILMDEPEISLHLSWQEKLLTQIRTINPDSQIIIVTHSPAIVMNGWLDCFVDIKDITIKG